MVRITFLPPLERRSSLSDPTLSVGAGWWWGCCLEKKKRTSMSSVRLVGGRPPCTTSLHDMEVVPEIESWPPQNFPSSSLHAPPSVDPQMHYPLRLGRAEIGRRWALMQLHSMSSRLTFTKPRTPHPLAEKAVARLIASDQDDAANLSLLS